MTITAYRSFPTRVSVPFPVCAHHARCHGCRTMKSISNVFRCMD